MTEYVFQLYWAKRVRGRNYEMIFLDLTLRILTGMVIRLKDDLQFYVLFNSISVNQDDERYS